MQVVKFSPLARIDDNGEYFIYHDNRCSLIYYFWGYGGNTGFWFVNRSDSNIYIDMTRSFILRNGQPQAYYRATTEIAPDQTVGVNYPVSDPWDVGSLNNEYFEPVHTSNRTLHHIESPYDLEVPIAETKLTRTMCVPAMSRMYINGYIILHKGFSRGDRLNDTPKKRDEAEFTPTTSPFMLENRIAYTYGDSKELNTICNRFYVSKIENIKSYLEVSHYLNPLMPARTFVRYKSQSHDNIYFSYTHSIFDDPRALDKHNDIYY